MKLLFLLFSLLIGICPASLHAWQQDFIRALKNGGAYVETEAGGVLLDHRSQEHFIPASTIKVATSACAIDALGLDYRFTTDFYLTQDKRLAIKGYGDPFLVSEEMALIAQELAKKKLGPLKGFVLDTSYFEENISIDGTARSANPYDALNGALIANFNTVYFIKKAQGQIVSAEPQTPLTPLARATAKSHPRGKHRVNLGKDTRKGARYTAELLAVLLQKEGQPIGDTIESGLIPTNARLIYRHRSSKNLEGVLKGLLEFSTNFMANQLFLVMGAKTFGPPASMDKGQRALNECLRKKIAWKDFTVIEGAGLSRRNRVTPRQMMALLRHFQAYQRVLPLEKGQFRAKTGTLTGVNSLAGYFRRQDGVLIRFVILVNDAVPSNYKFRLAQMLYSGINKKY